MIASAFCKNTVCNAYHRWVSRYQVWVHHMPPHQHHSLSMMGVLMHLCASPGLGAGSEYMEGEEEVPWELAGHGDNSTGNITFVRSPVVMNWIEEGYRLMWTVSPPPRREFANALSALEHRELVSGAVAGMLAADVVTLLEKP